jgi:cytochrome P450
VAGNLFLDILSTPSSLNLYTQLRSDAGNAFETEADWADPAALKKMRLTDSVIRESIRFSSIQIRGLLRAVVAEDGVTLPNGTHVARGTWLGVPVEAVHMDERFYDKPLEYDPFRFVRIRSGGLESQEKVDATEITDRFLGWSYGRYAW